MSFYKHKSGAQKRDAAAVTEHYLSKLPKLDNFFRKVTSDPQPLAITLQTNAVHDLAQLRAIDEEYNISARHVDSFLLSKLLQYQQIWTIHKPGVNR